ncbi:hypothetical protein Cch01nite_22980 [Cellulomonas chitinilytica]|uniref:Uncharacterized protein n=1 Tax=Cellulomonas chitinilytica TaxID=398759 RepID=A0A919P564_9CELL|nr:hypothetical protein Cch01nite_22980 [Cellulomonas chitinilytica]
MTIRPGNSLRFRAAGGPPVLVARRNPAGSLMTADQGAVRALVARLRTQHAAA